MIDQEPVIQVGILEGSPEIRGSLHGLFDFPGHGGNYRDHSGPS